MELVWEALNGRDGHSVGQALLESLYCRVTDSPLPEIVLSPRGKPLFQNSNWYFSISHTKNHVFCALSRKPIGIDAEEMDRRISPALSERWLSSSEQPRAEQAADGSGALLRLWVLKEAYAKQCGRGIGDYLKYTDFDPQDRRIHVIDGCYVAILEGK